MRLLKSINANLPYWLSLVVYIWGLEFQAIIGLGDFEPLYDKVTDCAAVLLTLAFWAIVTSVTVAVIAQFVAHSDGTTFSRAVSKVGVIVCTGLFFGRWLDTWSRLVENDIIITGVLGFSCLVLTGVALFRWIAGTDSSRTNMPSIRDFYQLGALPVLLIALSLVVFQMLRFAMSPPVENDDRNSLTTLASNKRRPNIIVMVADGLRASNMSLYGYQRDTTPNLKKLAARGNLYTRSYANVPATQASLTTLFTGKHPLTHRRMSRYQRPYDSDENLLKILRDHHYNTAAVAAVEDASSKRLGLSQYLSVKELTNFQSLSLHGLQTLGIPVTRAGNRMREDLWNSVRYWVGLPVVLQTYEPAEFNLDSAVTLMQKLKEPFFLFVHIFEPHDPYISYPPFKGMYSTEASARLQERSLSTTPYYSGAEQPIVEAYKDKYDETIRYLDFAIGRFLHYVDRAHWRNRLLLILTADHGESFEHGYHGHSEDLHDGSMHIPLFIQWPFQKERTTLEQVVQSVDIAPTILYAAGITVPSWMEGKALTPYSDPRPATVVAINHRSPENGGSATLPNQLAIWLENYKMILHCDTGKRELFDLSKDRQELNDLSGHEPAIIHELNQQMQRFLDQPQRQTLPSCKRHLASVS